MHNARDFSDGFHNCMLITLLVKIRAHLTVPISLGILPGLSDICEGLAKVNVRLDAMNGISILPE
jgi:hypothetical protein